MSVSTDTYSSRDFSFPAPEVCKHGIGARVSRIYPSNIHSYVPMTLIASIVLIYISLAILLSPFVNHLRPRKSDGF